MNAKQLVQSKMREIFFDQQIKILEKMSEDAKKNAPEVAEAIVMHLSPLIDEFQELVIGEQCDRGEI